MIIIYLILLLIFPKRVASNNNNNKLGSDLYLNKKIKTFSNIFQCPFGKVQRTLAFLSTESNDKKINQFVNYVQFLINLAENALLLY